jgi:hypothetical protein
VCAERYLPMLHTAMRARASRDEPSLRRWCRRRPYHEACRVERVAHNAGVGMRSRSDRLSPLIPTVRRRRQVSGSRMFVRRGGRRPRAWGAVPGYAAPFQRLHHRSEWRPLGAPLKRQARRAADVNVYGAKRLSCVRAARQASWVITPRRRQGGVRSPPPGRL